jgi:DNA-binding NarL/FixJ family response regulator
MELEDLVAEYRSVAIGPLILGEVRDVVRSLVRGYDPIVYGHVWRWQDGVEDLVQEFCLEVLIRQGQLDYALLVAADRQHFRRLLARQVRHLLARRRRRTIVDNLLDRARKIVSSPPFRLVAHRSRWSYTMGERPIEPGTASAEDLGRAVARLAALPVARASPSERAQAVYSTASLRALLETVAQELPYAVTVADLDRILTALLTSWLPRFLEEAEDGWARPGAPEATAEDRAIAGDIAGSIAARCTEVQWQVLGLKLRGVSDREVGRRLGLSRPTVAERKVEAVKLLAESVSDLSETVCALVVERLVEHVVDLGGGADET